MDSSFIYGAYDLLQIIFSMYSSFIINRFNRVIDVSIPGIRVFQIKERCRFHHNLLLILHINNI